MPRVRLTILRKVLVVVFVEDLLVRVTQRKRLQIALFAGQALAGPTDSRANVNEKASEMGEVRGGENSLGGHYDQGTFGAKHSGHVTSEGGYGHHASELARENNGN